MKILITGANGQLGLALIKAFSFNAPTFRATGLTRADLDISDETAVRSVIAGHKPDVLMNCAAYTAVDRAEAERDRAFAINERGAANLAKACKSVGALMIHFSTDYVFDGCGSRPYVETDTVAPLGVYGESKLAGERAVTENTDDHLIFRLSWVYSNEGANFYKTMLRLAAERDVLRIVADQFGTPNFTGDIADAVVRVLNHDRSFLKANAGTYHLSASGITHWHQFASEIIAHAQLAKRPEVVSITTAEFPTPAKRPAFSALDSSRFATTFGWNSPNWADGLRRCLAQVSLSS
jgi:dTDP-4-dehydrorhamnose reductase